MEMKALSAQSCCVHEKNMQHMHGNIPHMFDCWADPFSFPSTKELHATNILPNRWQNRPKNLPRSYLYLLSMMIESGSELSFHLT